MREHDVTAPTTSDLERLRRELAVSLALTRPIRRFAVRVSLSASLSTTPHGKPAVRSGICYHVVAL
jgi:hypothetical protein